MENTKSCPFCHKLIKDTLLNCPECGKSLFESETTEDSLSNLYWDEFGDSSIASDSSQSISLPDDPEELIKYVLKDKYNILSEAGRGGMAIIYKAVQKNLNREVALKVLPQQFVHDEEYLIRFHREAREVAKLNHPNIITIYDEGEAKGIHYLAMEFLVGKDLQEIIKEKGKLTIEQTIAIIAPIAEALGYLHEKGLVHRDIKSSNIFLSENNRPVLMDFGIALAESKTKLTQAGTIMGTPDYMSPEQAEGHPVDGRSDLFSLGAVLYECLSGVVPFRADNPLSIIRKIVDTEPESLRKIDSSIPKWLDEIVKITLNKNPDDRIQNGNLLSASLKNKKIIQHKHHSKISHDSIIDSDKTIKMSSNGHHSTAVTKDNTPPNKSSKLFPTLAGITLVIIAAATYYILFSESETIPQNKKELVEEKVAKTHLNVNSLDSISTRLNSESDSANNLLFSDSAKFLSDSIRVQNDSMHSKRENENDKTTDQKEVAEKIEVTEKPKTDYIRVLNKLQNELKAAKIEETEAKRKYDHAKKMKEKKMLSPKDFSVAKTNYESKAATVIELEKQISEIEKK